MLPPLTRLSRQVISCESINSDCNWSFARTSSVLTSSMVALPDSAGACGLGKMNRPCSELLYVDQQLAAAQEPMHLLLPHLLLEPGNCAKSQVRVSNV